jgi:hypothetical protein
VTAPSSSDLRCSRAGISAGGPRRRLGLGGHWHLRSSLSSLALSRTRRLPLSGRLTRTLRVGASVCVTVAVCVRAARASVRHWQRGSRAVWVLRGAGRPPGRDSEVTVPRLTNAPGSGPGQARSARVCALSEGRGIVVARAVPYRAPKGPARRVATAQRHMPWTVGGESVSAFSRFDCPRPTHRRSRF